MKYKIYICIGILWLLGITGAFLQCNRFSEITTFMTFLVPAFQLTLLFIVYLSLSEGFQITKYQINKSRLCLYLLVFFCGFSIYIIDIKSDSPWKSETLIAEDVIKITSGIPVNPFEESGDFPVKYMSYIAAATSLLFEDLRVGIKFVGVISNLLFVILVILICKEVSGIFTTAIALAPILSIWMIDIATSADNNWLCVIPLICSLQFYLYLRIAANNSKLWPLFTIVTALSIWTLYMPALSSLIVITFFMFDSRIQRSCKNIFFLTILPLIIPLFAASFTNSYSFNRHVEYLLQFGEGEKNISILDGYVDTVIKLTKLFINDLHRVAFPNRKLIFESTTLVLILFGLLFSPLRKSWNKTNLKLLFLFFSLNVLAFIISNPADSFWRTVILAPAFFIFAGLGLQTIFDLTTSKYYINSLLISIFIFIHSYTFLKNYSSYREHQSNTNYRHEEQTTVNVYEHCFKNFEGSYELLVPKEFNINVFNLLEKGLIKSVEQGEFVKIESKRNFTTKHKLKLYLNNPKNNYNYSGTFCNVYDKKGSLIAYLQIVK